MNKAEFTAALAEKLDTTSLESKKIVEAFIETVGETLAKDEKVVLAGFGTFEVRTRAERKGINPKTGESLLIPQQKTPAFKAGKLFKEAVR